MNARAVNFYEVLGLTENATPEQIKKAYRDLAKKHHPDSRGGDASAEETFKRISEAYSVLGDEKKRRAYDMQRKGGFPGGGNFNFGQGNGDYRVEFGDAAYDNLQDIFGNLFGGNGASGADRQSPFGGSPFGPEDIFSGRRASRRPQRGGDVESNVTIPFDVAVNGGETIIKTGSGKKIKIRIPVGIEEDKKIRIKGQGLPSASGGEAGDLYVRIKIAPHAEFERTGNDIHSKIYLTLAEAVLGTDVQIKTIAQRKVKLRIPPGTSSGKIFRLQGLGIQSQAPGDHYVRVEIDVPGNLTMPQRREFKNWAKKIGLLV